MKPGEEEYSQGVIYISAVKLYFCHMNSSWQRFLISLFPCKNPLILCMSQLVCVHLLC